VKETEKRFNVKALQWNREKGGLNSVSPTSGKDYVFDVLPAM